MDKLNAKLDMLIDSLPGRFISRAEYEAWRVWTIEKAREIDTNISAKHKALGQKVDEIVDDYEKNKELNWGHVGIGVAIIGSIISNAIAIANFMHHP